MGYIGNYKGLDVYDYNGATAAKFASIENNHIYTCSWRTSTEANVYFRGEFFGTLVEKADGDTGWNRSKSHCRCQRKLRKNKCRRKQKKNQ